MLDTDQSGCVHLCYVKLSVPDLLLAWRFSRNIPTKIFLLQIFKHILPGLWQLSRPNLGSNIAKASKQTSLAEQHPCPVATPLRPISTFRPIASALNTVTEQAHSQNVLQDKDKSTGPGSQQSQRHHNNKGAYFWKTEDLWETKTIFVYGRCQWR